MLRVRIAPLSDGRHTETSAPTPEDLDLDPAEFSDVAVAFTLDVSARQTAVQFTVSATAHLVCDRTAEPYTQRVEGTHAVVVVAADAPLAQADDEDVIVVPDEASHADVTAPVRDTLVLAVPLRRVSPAAEALDLQTTYGGPAADEPRDDRWAALGALRPDNGSDS